MNVGTIVNRSVLLVRAKEPLRAWLTGVFAPKPPPTLAEINTDCSAYLVPETEEEEENRAILRIAFTTLFEYELAEWCTDPDTWPDIRDRATFNEWFDCEFHTVVTDLAPGLIGPWDT
ncbi:MAG: hypothetical protein ACI8W8_001437 [Rhodothermales bacterium]|jgi:hypothetical protein